MSKGGTVGRVCSGGWAGRARPRQGVASTRARASFREDVDTHDKHSSNKGVFQNFQAISRWFIFGCFPAPESVYDENFHPGANVEGMGNPEIGRPSASPILLLPPARPALPHRAQLCGQVMVHS